MTQEPLTEKQLITIFGHQERTALSVEDIWASWPDIYPGTEPSESLEVLSKSPRLPAGGVVEETA